MKPLKILFVCIGNTCRSPMAESVMKHWVKEYDLNWEVDSAGLRLWNVGRKPDERCIKVLEENGLATDHIGRQISPIDFYKYDYILAMDEHNMSELQELAGDPSHQRCAKIELLGKYIERKEDQIIRDPYFSISIGGFRCAFLQITESCQNFIAEHMYAD
uniref:Low molecular weight phosphotyrosine protein phosphatase 1 n=1 Tax=Ceratitis capitata TaxID=7213 RepID=W8BAZ7_CERCA